MERAKIKVKPYGFLKKNLHPTGSIFFQKTLLFALSIAVEKVYFFYFFFSLCSVVPSVWGF